MQAPSLERRLEALEAASPSDRIDTLIWRIVTPGQQDGEIQQVSGAAGERWARNPGETEQELIDRASSEVRRNLLGVAMLTACAGDAG